TVRTSASRISNLRLGVAVSIPQSVDIIESPALKSQFAAAVFSNEGRPHGGGRDLLGGTPAPGVPGPRCGARCSPALTGWALGEQGAAAPKSSARFCWICCAAPRDNAMM